ncbi:MAG: hypothetical protein Q7U30_03670, partial [Methylicorpusculum sp.]|nr:hypothetical protein [Methylicorpusculum sp.]
AYFYFVIVNERTIQNRLSGRDCRNDGVDLLSTTNANIAIFLVSSIQIKLRSPGWPPIAMITT